MWRLLLLAGLALGDRRTPVAGDASGSDWVNTCIDLDWHSKETTLSATPSFDFETAAPGTSQACGAGRITLGFLIDVQRKNYDRGTISDEMKFGLYFPTPDPSDSTPGDEYQWELFPSVGFP